MTAYQLRDVEVTVKNATILQVDHLELRAPSLVAIAGPNGAGKSTLLAILSGLRKEFTGQCLYLGKDIRLWSRREFARTVAVVTQNYPITFPFSVEQVVSMGRTPHAPGWFESPDDLLAVHEALNQTDSLHLRQRDFRTLSGGEQQRVILATALAQQPRVLLLDEPNTFLDLHHQVHLYRLLTRLRDGGMLVMVITHDLNLSAAYADRFLLLNEGQVVADDLPENVITAERMREIFRIDAELHRNDAGSIWMRYGV